MAKTQKNKATSFHLGQLKAKLSKLKKELLTPTTSGGGGGAGAVGQEALGGDDPGGGGPGGGRAGYGQRPVCLGGLPPPPRSGIHRPGAEEGFYETVIEG